MITWQDLVNIDGSFSKWHPTRQAAVIKAVAARLPDGALVTWGNADKLAHGQALLGAHIATIFKSRGLGPVTDNEADAVRQSYQPFLQRGSLGTTTYGNEFIDLCRTLPTALGL